MDLENNWKWKLKMTWSDSLFMNFVSNEFACWVRPFISNRSPRQFNLYNYFATITKNKLRRNNLRRTVFIRKLKRKFKGAGKCNRNLVQQKFIILFDVLRDTAKLAKNRAPRQKFSHVAELRRGSDTFGRLMARRGKLIKARAKQDSFGALLSHLIISKILTIRRRCVRVPRTHASRSHPVYPTRFPECPALSSSNNNNNKKGWRPVLIRGSACLTWLTRRGRRRRDAGTRGVERGRMRGWLVLSFSVFIISARLEEKGFHVGARRRDGVKSWISRPICTLTPSLFFTPKLEFYVISPFAVTQPFERGKRAKCPSLLFSSRSLPDKQITRVLRNAAVVAFIDTAINRASSKTECNKGKRRIIKPCSTT